MKLNQNGTMALPLTLIIAAVLAGAAYYNSNFSQISSEAVHSDLGRGEVADTLDKYLHEKASDLKFKIGSLLAEPTVNASDNIHNVLTSKLVNNDLYKCQANPSIKDTNQIVVKSISSNDDIVFICKEITMDQKEGYLLEARIRHKGTLKPKYKKAFVAARIPVGYMTLTRNEPTRENNFLKPNLPKIAISKNMPVYLHDKITTGESSFAHITMLDDTILNLGPNSIFQIDNFELTDKTDVAKRKGVYNLINGFIRANFTKRSKNNLIIKTHTVAMGIRGTTFTIWTGIINGKKTSIFNLLEGKVEVIENDQSPLSTPIIMDAGENGATPNYTEIQASDSNPHQISVRQGQLTKEVAQLHNQLGDRETVLNSTPENYEKEILELIRHGSPTIEERLETPVTGTPPWILTQVESPIELPEIKDVEEHNNVADITPNSTHFTTISGQQYDVASFAQPSTAQTPGGVVSSQGDVADLTKDWETARQEYNEYKRKKRAYRRCARKVWFKYWWKSKRKKRKKIRQKCGYLKP